jgi:hypothetical protein
MTTQTFYQTIDTITRNVLFHRIGDIEGHVEEVFKAQIEAKNLEELKEIVETNDIDAYDRYCTENTEDIEFNNYTIRDIYEKLAFDILFDAAMDTLEEFIDGEEYEAIRTEYIESRRSQTIGGLINDTTEKMKNDELDPEITCSICLSESAETEPDQEWVKTKCNHYFHKSCIIQIKCNNCPNCRTEFKR